MAFVPPPSGRLNFWHTDLSISEEGRPVYQGLEIFFCISGPMTPTLKNCAASHWRAARPHNR